MKRPKYESYILWIVIIFSIGSLFFSPTKPIIEQLQKNLPWVASGILLSETTLTLGFLMMLSIATPAFVRSLTKSIKNAVLGIIHIKKMVDEFDWAHVANKCNDSKIFWLGFWISVLGALGDGVVLIFAIGNTLPYLLGDYDITLLGLRTYLYYKTGHFQGRQKASTSYSN